MMMNEKLNEGLFLTQSNCACSRIWSGWFPSDDVKSIRLHARSLRSRQRTIIESLSKRYSGSSSTRRIPSDMSGKLLACRKTKGRCSLNTSATSRINCSPMNPTINSIKVISKTRVRAYRRRVQPGAILLTVYFFLLFFSKSFARKIQPTIASRLCCEQVEWSRE